MPKTPSSAKKVASKSTRATSFEPAVAKAFGEVIRTLRVESGLAQDKFALVANIDRSYYGKLERGERQPSLALLLRVSSGLGISGVDLMGLLERQLNPAAEV